jgi:hypothetical protein
MIFHFSLLTAQETIIDTVYSIPYLDGCITYCPGLGYFGIGTDSIILVGDYYSNLLWDYFFNRGFIAFDIPCIPSNYILESAILNIFQSLSVGNDIIGEYPIFNMQTGIIEPPCFIEHLDYGYTLDETDFFLTPLHFIGTISDTPEEGWRSIEVTEYVLDDIENTRPFTQYRLRLSLDTDNDSFMDALYFRGGDSPTDQDPFIVLIYEQENNIDDDYCLGNLVEFSNYPNPFNPETTISFKISCRDAKDTEIVIYNIKGQIIKTFPISNSSLQISNQVVWDGRDSNGKRVGSGIYFYKISAGKSSAMKKMLLLK